METLNILNSRLDDIKGFSGNSSLRTFNLTSSNITNLNGQSFAGSGSSNQFEIYINGTTISTISNFSSSRVSKLDIRNSTVTTFADNSFASSSNLRTLNILESSTVNSINYRSFYNCTNLATLDLNSSCRITTLGSESFKNCDLSTKFDLSNHITTIGNDAFANSRTTKAIFTENLNNMGVGVYSNCQNITQVDFRLNRNITKIPDRTFYNNILLRTVELPSHIVGIGESTFKIESYNSNTNNQGVSSIDLNRITSLGNSCFMNSGVSTFIPNSNLRNIPISAFENCDNIRTLNFDNVSELVIQDRAFFNTTSIDNNTNLYMLTSVGNSAFEESSIYVDYNNNNEVKIKSIGNRAFYHCKRLEWFPFFSWYYKNQSISMGNEAFAYANLTRVGEKEEPYTNKIRPEFNSIGTGAFKYSGIRWVARDSFEANITSIPSECFRGIGSSTEYTIPNNSVYVYNYTLPWKSIGSYAFEGANKIKHGPGTNTFLLNQNSSNEANGANITRIGTYAFANIQSFIENIQIGRVETIENYAFFNSDIYDIINDGNDNVYWGTSIGNWAFGHSEGWNNSLANNIRNKGSPCKLGTIINRARVIGNGAFNNLAGTPSNGGADIAYHDPIRILMVWNGDRYDNLISVGESSFEYNYIQRDSKSGSNNSVFPRKLEYIGTRGFRSTRILENTSFISPFLNNDFGSSTAITTIDDYAFQNNFHKNYSLNNSNNKLYLPHNLLNIGKHAFHPAFSNYTIVLKSQNLYRARSGNTGLRYDFYVTDTRFADNICLNFNGARLENNSGGHTLVDNLKTHFHDNFTGGYSFG